jgi:hypothetical protein
MIVDIVMLSDINLIVSYLNSFLDDLSHVYQDIFGTCESVVYPNSSLHVEGQH